MDGVMFTLEELKKQNEDLTELCDVLCVILQDSSLQKNSYVIDLMNSFKEKVWMHLVFEDDTIYYELLKHPDDEIRNTIDSFHQSGRAIKKQFSAFIRNWNAFTETGEKHDSVHNECRDVFSLIRERIRYESEQIFPLVQQLHDEPAAFTGKQG